MTPNLVSIPPDTTVETAQVHSAARRAGEAGRSRGWSDGARGALAFGVALLVHAALFFATSGLPCGFNHAPRSRAELDSEPALVPLEAFEAPEPTPVPDAQAAAPRAQAAPSAPAARAAAPSVPAAEPVADFTDLAVAFESATTYAVASSRAVVGAVSGAVGGAGRAGGAGTGSQGASGPGGGSGGTAPASAAPVQAARPVSNQWRCPWPSAAVAADLYRQSVTVRVVISADGTVERATALRDPGHGFGAAAESCARRERFIPARDAGGQPMRSTAPVRVGFER